MINPSHGQCASCGSGGSGESAGNVDSMAKTASVMGFNLPALRTDEDHSQYVIGVYERLIKQLQQEIIDNDERCLRESMKDVLFNKEREENKFCKESKLKWIGILRESQEKERNNRKFMP